MRPKAFTITLADISAAGLNVLATAHAHEHLEVVGDMVKIMEFTRPSEDLFITFEKNRVAIALGIDTLGWEIFGSLFVLYWRDGLQTKAHDLHLLPEMGQPHAVWLKVIFSLDCVQSAAPHVLASRVLALEKLIQHRVSYWPSLMRDINQTKKEQPYIYWGTILATFFGICAVIQTVVSVWSLVLAIQAA